MNVAKWPRQSIPGVDPLLAVALLGLTFALHGSALGGNWRWDDGTHLLRASEYPVWRYFLDPEVLRFVSGNQITPWNIFIYALNLQISGFQPWAYYLHHLLSLGVAVVALYLLLRQWLTPSRAAVAPVLMLVGVPTGQMAQQLMVGHYIAGLAFACLSLWAFVRATRGASGRAGWSFLAAVAYLVACLCKEIFVPVVALMPFLASPGRGRTTFLVLSPSVLVAALYVFGRWQLFSGFGGYHGRTAPGVDDLAHLATVVPTMFGGGAIKWLAIVGSLTAIGLTLIAGWRSGGGARWRVLVMGGVVLMPLIFLAGTRPDWGLHARYLFVPWLAICVLWAHPWPGRAARWQWVVLALVFTSAAIASLERRGVDGPIEAMFDAHTRYVLDPEPGTWLLPAQFNGPGYVTAVSFSVRAARDRSAGRTYPSGEGGVIGDAQVMREIPVSVDRLPRVRYWDSGCLCLRSLAQASPAQRESLEREAGVDFLFAPDWRPPFPRVANGVDGAMSIMPLRDTELAIRGWTPTVGPGRQLLLLGAYGRTQSTIKRLPDRAPYREGFEVILKFADAQAAERARKSVCAVVLSHRPGQEHQYKVLVIEGEADAARRCVGLQVPDRSHAFRFPKSVAG